MLHEIDLSRADLNLFVLFEAVLRERHVGRAAERLSLSPSAVSHGLGRLRRLLNDPLFLKHPKGVVATARALELAEPIAEILARVRAVVAAAERFDPATSRRRFVLGAPDAAADVVLPPLLQALSRTAPHVDLSVRALMPQTALADLDAREIDLAVEPLGEVPPRFVCAPLYVEEFVIAMRHGHPLGPRPTLDAYCAASHVLLSLAGDPHGNVDLALAALGRTRRVAVTAPHFLSALALAAETDLLAAVPRRHAERHAARLGISLAPPPAPLAPLGRSPVAAVATRAAMADAGVAWLFHLLAATCADPAAERPDGRRLAP
jgi:DNA-binding transcriptional LysR family regulator